MIKPVHIYKFHLFLFFALLIPALGLYGQQKNFNTNPKITLTLSSGTPLRQALLEISKLTSIQFIYADKLIDGVESSGEWIDTDLNIVLIQILAPTRLGFRQISGGQMVLYQPGLTEIIGYIFDGHTKESLANTNVYLKYSKYGTSTNREGFFILSGVPNRPSILTADYVGYEPTEYIVRPDTLTGYLKIFLRPLTFLSKKINVFAAGNEMIDISSEPSKISISPENFSSLPRIGGKDIFRSLQLLPGIVSSSNGSSSLAIRGGMPSENLMQLDGITLYHLDHFFGFFNALNADALKNVQVYKGGFPAKYGGKTSGVVDIIAKNGNMNKPGIKARINQLSYNLEAETPLWGLGSFIITGRHSYRKDILETLYQNIFKSSLNMISGLDNFHFYSKPKITFYDLLAKLTIIASKKNILNISYYLSKDDNQIQYNIDDTPGDSLTWFADIFKLSSAENVKWGNSGYSLNWFKQWSDRFFSTSILSLSNYYSNTYNNGLMQYKFVYDDVDTVFTDTLSTRYNNNLINLNAHFDGSWHAPASNNIDFGVGFTQIKLKYKAKEKYWEDEVRQEAQTQQLVCYLQDKWHPSTGITTTIGLRTIHDQLTASTVWEPRLSLEIPLINKLSVKSSWGYYHQFINQVSDGLPHLDGNINWILADKKAFNPTFAEHRIIGLSYQTNDFLVDIEAYHKQLKGIFTYEADFSGVQSDSVRAFRNTGNGYIKGFDLLLQKKTGVLNGWVSYSYMKTHVSSRIDNNIVSYVSTRDRPHNIKCTLNFRYHNWTLSTVWMYVSGSPYSLPSLVNISGNSEQPFMILGKPKSLNSKRLPPVHRLDFSLIRQFNYQQFSASIGLSIFNAYNRKNVWRRNFIIKNNQCVAVDIYSFGIKPTLFAEISF